MIETLHTITLCEEQTKTKDIYTENQLTAMLMEKSSLDILPEISTCVTCKKESRTILE